MIGQTNHFIAEHSLQKQLRVKLTDAENKLWRRLRGQQILDCKFRRQHPFLNFILDFVCLERRLVIEVDGGQHLDNEADRRRDECMRDAGFHVLRFWNNQVLMELDAVVESIYLALEARGARTTEMCGPHPHPGPHLEGEGEVRPGHPIRGEEQV